MVRLASDLRQRHGLKGRPTSAARLNLSLNFVGTFRGPPTRAVMEKAIALADKVVAAPFQVTLNHVQSWNDDPHPLVLLGEEGVIGVQLLNASLHKALASGNMAPRREPEFLPHVSLLRDKRDLAQAFVEPIGWRAREFVLLDSPDGDVRLEVLGRWPLVA
ncbi:2'-5' RNA ligase family protein [Phenylobacterium sp.]|uniref:2'-5' RNA ligase family protein n=1 Tax=Phenylobacterium sp. TaxID=1871053 RepID=UPI00121729C6|nr:2'-5' RNA ligase family protein [Phenylobacterium sp.]THD54156.1 MAG: hypothetical protein E8A12_17785 [Phenylobacterium sp.]